MSGACHVLARLARTCHLLAGSQQGMAMTRSGHDHGMAWQGMARHGAAWCVAIIVNTALPTLACTNSHYAGNAQLVW